MTTETKMCRRCRERLQMWRDAPICAFAGPFAENWNCATLNRLRDICYEGHNPRPSGVDYQYCDDQKYATIKIDECEMPNGARIGLALWVTWYKSRGRTDRVWVLSDEGVPRVPTEAELEAVIRHYE